MKMSVLEYIKRRNPQQEDEEIDMDGIRKVEKKNKITVQECTYPSTLADNFVTKYDDGSPEERDFHTVDNSKFLAKEMMM
jgi:hypothetical protein